jgi:hypothetical protein
VSDLDLLDCMSDGQASMFMFDANTVVRHDMSRPQEILPHNQDSNMNDLLRPLADRAIAAAQRRSNATVTLLLANFQTFLLLSACAALYYGNLVPSKTAVLDVVRILIGKDAGEVHCVRTLRSAVYMNEIADRLDAHGWKHRGSELILICR